MGSRSIRFAEVGSWIVLNALWVALAFQEAALITIAVPAALLHIAPHSYVAVLSALASISAAAAMAVPPVAGWFSDHIRSQGGGRRMLVIAGVILDIAGLLLLTTAHDVVLFAVYLVLAMAGANIAIAAYQALLPDLIPREKWGAVSGIRGAATLVGTIVGLAIAGVAPNPSVTFLCTAIAVAICSLSLPFIRETRVVQPEPARVRDWHDFIVVFVARFFVFFGLALLQTFVLYYFRDIQRLGNPTLGTAIAAFCTMIGAVASSVYVGILSDRAPRKIVTAVAGIPMAISAIGFAVAPAPQWIFLYAFLFGIGFGGVFSSGWALAMDSMPAMRDVARDLGIWGIATNIPNVFAPLVGGWMIGAFHNGRPGYQAVFALAGLCFALASLSVLRVGRHPLTSLWGWPLRFAANTSNYVFVRMAYRIRHWGGLPRKRGPSLIVANHQHDLESMTIVSTTFVESGSWRHGLFTASSRRMYEPGFLAMRLPWLSFALRPFNFGQLFRTLGMMPLENELSSREVSALAWSVQQRHGPLLLSDIFDPRVAGQFPQGTRTSDLTRRNLIGPSRAVVKVATLREPYRREVLDETRAFIASDFEAMEDVVRRGATFYLTPEGRYSTDGRIGPMRGAIDRLAPLAQVYLAGVSYDPFVSKRLSMLFRVAPYADRESLSKALAALRPVVASQLIAQLLHESAGPFSEEDVRASVRERLARLPATLFVDPELRKNPDRLVHSALPLMVGWKILERNGGSYAVSAVRRHPQFPQVDDIVAFNARMLDETIENASWAPSAIACA